MFFSSGFGALTTSKNSCRHDQNFHGITRGKPRFRSKKVQIRGYKNCSCQASGRCFFFQFLGVWRFCLYLWVPYNLGHAFLTLFTVAALLFWCFLSRLVLEANERRKVLDGGFLGGFFTFQGCAYIYGFLITWGIPFHLCSQWQRFYFGIFYLDSSWKRMKEGKCWPDDFSVVSLLFKDVLISMGSL